MLKRAFSVAELLITISIIGLIAIITIPALLTYNQESQSISGLKKGVNTLTNIAQISSSTQGFDFYSTTSDAILEDNKAEIQNSFFGIISRNASINRDLTGPAKYVNAEDLYAIFLRDGAAIIYSPEESISNTRSVLVGDDETLGFTIYYDINGLKGPNLLSNCRGAKYLQINNPNGVPPIGEACNDGNKRVIKDIFKLKAQATRVIPNEPSSVWALNK